jgi:hypothetical protein
LPSITTVIGETKSAEAKAALANWKKRQEDKAPALQMAAANRGTWTHSQAEIWISEEHNDLPGGTYLVGPNSPTANSRNPTASTPTALTSLRNDLPGRAQRLVWGCYWRSLRGWLQANFHSALAIEKPVWHPAGFSGTFDCLGWTYDSTDVALFDWKTRGGKPLDPHGEQLRGYCVQLAAYRAGVSWTYGIEVDRGYVVMARPDGDAHVVELDRHLLMDCEAEFFDRLRTYQQLQQTHE